MLATGLSVRLLLVMAAISSLCLSLSPALSCSLEVQKTVVTYCLSTHLGLWQGTNWKLRPVFCLQSIALGKPCGLGVGRYSTAARHWD